MEVVRVAQYNKALQQNQKIVFSNFTGRPTVRRNAILL